MIVYGKNPVMEALEAKRPIIQATILEHTNRDLEERLRSQGVPIVTMAKNRFQELYRGVTQGIVAEVADYHTWNLKSWLDTVDLAKFPLVVLLDGIQDPHNLGAIIRSVEAGGGAGVIIPKNRSASVTPVVVKTSSGAIEYVPVIEVTNLTQAIESLKTAGFWIVGTAVDGTADYTSSFADRPVVLCIGSEGKGMSRLVKEHCDQLVKVPMQGKINSLNASVTAGIIIFDILRRKRE
jgi:23S rRNA (guanosine2251-2'-O)-methyltransferase